MRSVDLVYLLSWLDLCFSIHSIAHHRVGSDGVPFIRWPGRLYDLGFFLLCFFRSAPSFLNYDDDSCWFLTYISLN